MKVNKRVSARIQKAIDDGCVIAYWCSDAHARPANHQLGDEAPRWTVRPGLVQKVKDDGRILLCGRGLHATYEPHRWAGVRVWLVALSGRVEYDHGKMAATERRILCEVTREHAMSPSVGVRIGRKDLSCANLREANLNGADLRRADLREADLSWANIRRADLSCANLSGADLSWANLSGADLRRADLSCANLRGADLSCANLREANLNGADLSGANLSCANLREANLSCANLSGANLNGADLSGANLREANLYLTIGLK